MKRIVITGANGFIGKKLINKLLEDRDTFIYAIVRNKNSNTDELLAFDNMKILYCDMDNIDSIAEVLKDENITSFFHLAWEGSTGPERADYEIQMRNVINSIKAFETSEKLGCKKFLSAGTISERLIEQIPILDKISQNMIYALAKKTTYDMLNIKSKNSLTKIVWMQFSNIFGPGNTSGNLISYTLGEMRAGKSPEYGSGKQPYNFMYIDDLIQAIVCLEKSELSKNKYFIGSGETMLLKDYLTMIPKILNIDTEMGIGKRTDDGLCYKEEWFDISELKRDTDYTTQVSFEEGIKLNFSE